MSSDDYYSSSDDQLDINKRRRMEFIREVEQFDKTKDAVEIKKKWKDKLENYHFANKVEELEVGGYIKYVDFNWEIKSGGILIGKIDNNKKLLLKNDNYVWNIKVENYYIFYKKNITVERKENAMLQLLKKAGYDRNNMPKATRRFKKLNKKI